MYIVYFTCITPQGHYQDCNYGGKELESCLSALNALVATDWQLLTIYLRDGNKSIPLPVEAFDGEPVEKPLALLQLQWQAVLSGF